MISSGISTIRASLPFNSMRTFPSAKPFKRPSKNFASPIGSVVDIFASRPANLWKSAAVFSSPGMDRALKNAAGFQRFAGRRAKISTTEPIGDAKFFEGRLKGFAEGKVRMELKGKEARIVEIPLEIIRKANLAIEF